MNRHDAMMTRAWGIWLAICGHGSTAAERNRAFELMREAVSATYVEGITAEDWLKATFNQIGKTP